MDVRSKLAILADAAKYDASCASSGAKGRRATAKGIGSTEGIGICHSYTPDGRCVSLLKILLTNYCIYDCAYCINRRSSGVRRARFTPTKSSASRSSSIDATTSKGCSSAPGSFAAPDYTMEQLIDVARTLRAMHGFAGYIHLKTIPNAAPRADRRSGSLGRSSEHQRRAADGSRTSTRSRRTRISCRSAAAMRRHSRRNRRGEGESRDDARARRPEFRAGRTSDADDRGRDVGAPIATSSRRHHRSTPRERLRRVYYSAFSPIPDARPTFRPRRRRLLREHRLYQADWLMRFYGFTAGELTAEHSPQLDLAIDPKLAWALQHRGDFPLDLNAAPREMLLRVPGIGVRSVDRIVAAAPASSFAIRRLAPASRVARARDAVRRRRRLSTARAVAGSSRSCGPRSRPHAARPLLSGIFGTNRRVVSVIAGERLDGTFAAFSAWRRAASVAIRAHVSPDRFLWRPNG